MKLLRLKIMDPAGFRSLPCGFEHHFRTEWSPHDELAQSEGFAPFVCAGPNGSGKSNLLEALAAIFYQLELQRMQRSFLPEVFFCGQVESSSGMQEIAGHPNVFELEYLIYLPFGSRADTERKYAQVRVLKLQGESPRMYWLNAADFGEYSNDLGVAGLCGEQHRSFLLPAFVLGYSSGENEILSLSFFKMRFVQFDRYWANLKNHQSYVPETRMIYLDNNFSQAILLCNLLFADEGRNEPLTSEIGIEALQEFRIVLRRSVMLDEAQAQPFIRPIERADSPNAATFQTSRSMVSVDDAGRYRLDVLSLLEERNSDRIGTSSLPLDALRRCATLEFHDEVTDTLVLDYWVNSATRQAFRDSFDGDPRVLFQAFQTLLTLNLYSVSDTLKTELYRSDSHYVSETVPQLASDERVMRFKFVRFAKKGLSKSFMLKSLSDGEHQLLHSLGLCLLFRDTNSLILMDEPETHFNPAWRSSFISQLRKGLSGRDGVGQEMLISTHSPFLISDSNPNKVLVFAKDKTTGAVSISHPNYNTLGASINKITMNTFGKRETIGGHAQALLEALRARFEQGGEDKEALITEIHQQLGDSVEKVLLIKAILDGDQPSNGEAQS